MENYLEEWILTHIHPPARELYFKLNADIPLYKGSMTLYIDIPQNGRMVCILHPDLMTQVAHICYRKDVRMIQMDI